MRKRQWWGYPYAGVYAVAAAEVGRVKFGVTGDMQKRFSQLSAASPSKLEVLHIIRCADRNFEKLVHRFLYSCKFHGEWFFHQYRAADFVDLLCRAGRMSNLDHAVNAMYAIIEAGAISYAEWDEMQAARKALGARQLKEASPFFLEEPRLPARPDRGWIDFKKRPGCVPRCVSPRPTQREVYA